MSEEQVRQAFQKQIMWCDRLGSPFTARLLGAATAVLDRETPIGARILDWKGQPDASGDALPLRLAGGLHAIVRAGRLPELALLYPPHSTPAAVDLRRTLEDVFRVHSPDIDPWLDLAPQTNEVARSAVLYPGLMTIASLIRLPIVLFEIGSSAGLNLMLDRYAYTLGGRVFGDTASALQLAPEWEGSAPLGDAPVIKSRLGCDFSPLDLKRDGDRARLKAYIWPDQIARLDRLSSAIDIVSLDPPHIDCDDAADWVERVIRPAASLGETRVLMHSIMFGYLRDDTRQRIASHMEAVGEQADDRSPLAWLAFELDGEFGISLTLRLWPGGETRILARADAHARRIVWLAG